MQRKGEKSFALRKTLSNSMSEAPTVPDITESSGVPSKRFLYESGEELNLAKLCLSNKKISELDRSQTSRTAFNHLEAADNINKRFQRTN